MPKSKTKDAFAKYYPWLLIIGGIIGILAAGILIVEKIALLKHPDMALGCDINPIVACGSVINTPQASAFGFPNPIIGLVGFGVVLTTGMAMLAGAQFKRWYWLGLQAGTIFGVSFIHWLFFESVYRIHALCPYCMVVWSVTIPIFLYTTLWNLRQGYLRTPKSLKKVVAFAQANHPTILLLWYVTIAGLILKHFWYFFGPH